MRTRERGRQQAEGRRITFNEGKGHCATIHCLEWRIGWPSKASNCKFTESERASYGGYSTKDGTASNHFRHDQSQIVILRRAGGEPGDFSQNQLAQRNCRKLPMRRDQFSQARLAKLRFVGIHRF